MSRPGPGYRPGLCSVTLRAHSVGEVLRLARSAGLAAIEWGGDVHVPADPRLAREVGRLTADAGLAVSSYGSYYRTGVSDPAEFAGVLACGRAMGAPRIRVWAGASGSAETDGESRRRVVADARRIGALAAGAGVRVGFEYHGGTLTDTPASTVDLLEAVDLPTVGTYWQPPVGMPDAEALADLGRIATQVEAVHVFSWWPGWERLRLSARAGLWRGVFDLLSRSGRRLDALLEFVPDDDPGLLAGEAGALRSLLSPTG